MKKWIVRLYKGFRGDVRTFEEKVFDTREEALDYQGCLQCYSEMYSLERTWPK